VVCPSLPQSQSKPQKLPRKLEAGQICPGGCLAHSSERLSSNAGQTKQKAHLHSTRKYFILNTCTIFKDDIQNCQN
jgi:hypothetical protein